MNYLLKYSVFENIDKYEEDFDDLKDIFNDLKDEDYEIKFYKFVLDNNFRIVIKSNLKDFHINDSLISVLKRAVYFMTELGYRYSARYRTKFDGVSYKLIIQDKKSLKGDTNYYPDISCIDMGFYI
jgi:hypothetical protein